MTSSDRGLPCEWIFRSATSCQRGLGDLVTHRGTLGDVVVDDVTPHDWAVWREGRSPEPRSSSPACNGTQADMSGLPGSARTMTERNETAPTGPTEASSRGLGMSQLSPLLFPSVDEIRANRARLGDLVITTPVRVVTDDALVAAVGGSTRVWLKEELFQRTGSFKPRGALSVMLDLDAGALARGVTGVSAGNHAISLAYSARILGTTAKVVMPETANRFRVKLCEDLGGLIEFVGNVHQAFDRAEEIAAVEGRSFVHPFEGPKTALGTASVGMEFVEQVRDAGASLDAVIVAVGGGGLSGGVACAVKQMVPTARVYAVEPEGADSLSRSFRTGSPEAIDAVRTIADSLGAPRCEPYSFELNRRFVDDVVLVTDGQIREAMRVLFRSAKLVSEPAGAAALAALMYPLHGRLDGMNVGIVVCGANIDPESFARYILPG